MNTVFISPEFPSHYHRFCVQLRAAGATVLGIGQTSHSQLHPELRAALHDYYQMPDLHANDGLDRAIGYFIWRHGRIGHIDSLNEYWLESEARLRDDFNIPGLRTRDLPCVKRKSEMKEIFRGAGLPVAPGELHRDAAQTRAFLRETGFPVIAKPDIGVGANKTFVIHDEAEQEKFLNDSPEGYFLEKYLEGFIQTFDGLADSERRPLFHGSLQYSGTLDMVRDIIDTSYFTLRRIPDDLNQMGRKTLKAFNVRGRFFHFEYFRTGDGRLWPLEVNVRPPGGLTIDMFNYSSDIDLYRLWADVVTARAGGLSYARPFHCGYIGRKSRKRYLHTHKQVLERCSGRLVAHQPMDAVFHTAMGDYGYLIRSPDLDEISALTEFTLAAGPRHDP
ncbi:MAG TPA: carboxylate--amine ligase [Acidobacteriota bacterium]|nr:carboxylate--amine ligase [Acidobacteriota bacterium]